MLIGPLSISRNIFMGREINGGVSFMDHKKMEQAAIEILGRAG